MTSAKFILLGLLLVIGSAPVLGDEAGKGGAHDVVVAKVAAPAAEAQPAAPTAAADKAVGTPARPKAKRQRHRKAAAPAAGKEAQVVASGQGPAPADAGHAPAAQPGPVVAAAVAPTVRVTVKDRAAAAVAVAAAQVVDNHPAHAHSHPAAVAQEEHPAHAAPEAAPAPAAVPATPPTAVVVHGEECNPPFKTEVAALFDRWNASLRTGDPRKVVANYAPDSVLLPTLSNRARFTAAEKEEYFVHFLLRRPEGRIDDRVIETDCNSAIDSGLYTFRFMDGSSVKARYTFAYKRVNGEWLISSHHSSAMPEKATGVDAAHAGASDDGSPARGWVRFP